MSQIKNASRTVREEFREILGFVGSIWAVFLVSRFFPIDEYGVRPRSLVGLLGIVTMPFLHSGLRHLLSNTVPLLVLLTLLAGSRARSWEIVAKTVLASGTLLWLFGRSANHIGASGLVFGLITFLLLSGFFEQRLVPLLVSLLVGFLYGTTLFFGVLPLVPGVSWDGHLCGAVAGAVVAYLLTGRLGKQDEGPIGVEG